MIREREYTVLGIKHISYVNKQQRQIEGNKLYLINNLTEVDLGQACEDVFLNSKVDITGIEVGSSIDLVYNRYGAVVGIEIND